MNDYILIYKHHCSVTNLLIFLLENDDVLSSLLSDHKITLVCVKVAPINRGVPAPQTSICIPEAQDLDKLHEDFSSLYNNGLRDCLGPKEGKHWDPYRKERFVSNSLLLINYCNTCVIKSISSRISPVRDLYHFNS